MFCAKTIALKLYVYRFIVENMTTIKSYHAFTNGVGGVFTRGQFWPSANVVVCVCLCECMCLPVCLCVCQPWAFRRHSSSRVQARTIIFGQKMQNNFVKVSIVLGAIDPDLQGQIKLENPNLTHFEIVHTITHHLFKLEPQNLDKICN